MESRGSDGELLYKVPFAMKDGKNWKRFCLLPNIQGQKYTFGSTFTTREEQCEFIFLSKHQLDKLNQPEGVSFDSVFQILCDADNSYWAEPLGGNVIFVNDVKTETREKLEFGDFLSLDENKSKDENDYDREQDYDVVKEVRFSFQKRELLPEAWNAKGCRNLNLVDTGISKESTEVGDGSHDFDPIGENDLVFSHILSYLPIPSLKDARFVSQKWNEEAFKMLRKKCTTDFNLCGDYCFARNTMQLFRYDLEMKGAKMANLFFALPWLTPEEDEDSASTSGGKTGAKFLSDLDTFLDQGHLQHVKTLGLCGRIHSQLEFQQQIHILRKASESLKHFHLAGAVYTSELTRIDLFPGLRFPKMEGFTLSLEVIGQGYHEVGQNLPRAAVAWLESLIPSIIQISKLRLSSSPSVGLILLQNLTSFQNLQEIVLFQTTPEDMKLLLKFPRSLKTLKLNQLKIMEKNEDWMLFEILLLKHSKELKSLKFILPAVNKGEPQRSINLPNFPKLVYLDVGCEINVRNQGETHPTLTFDGRGINYEANFPSLGSLRVWPKAPQWRLQFDRDEMLHFWEEFKGFFETFFPRGANSQICRTLRVLNVAAINDTKRKVSLTYIPLLQVWEIAQMFPNCELSILG